MDWRIFIAGVIVGWLIELAIDWFYWRRPEDEVATATDTITMAEHRSQLQSAEERIQRLEADLESARNGDSGELMTAQAEVERLRADLAASQESAAEHQTCTEQLAAAEAEIGRLRDEVRRLQPVDPDNLKRIEGIGPKIESILNDAGILTFQQLAAAEVTLLQEILSAAGERYRLADPGSWPRQAGLAAAEKWDELSQLQDELKGGRS